ncbi:MAG TPA: DUF2378 family protein [Thermoanaerobaculia bacterium]|nr:DUF2378 family protein [Thermoanaerobaculia bacterium]
MQTESSVTVKGSPIRSLQAFLQRELTPAQREDAFSTLSPDDSTKLRSRVVAIETYPLATINRLTEAAARAKGEPLEQFARRAGRAAASDAIRGVYRFFVLVLTPTALLSKAANMWRTVYSAGELRVESATATSARIRLSDFPSESAGCGLVTGWMEQLADLTGVTGVEISHTKCVAHGAEECEWKLKWR